MSNYSSYRITTDGTFFRVEKAFPSADPTKEPVWVVISNEMTYLAEAQIALDRANNPPVWRPVTTA